MRIEVFKRGMVSILLVFALMFSMISIAPLASSGDWVNEPAPGGTIIDVMPGDNFLIRYTLEWNEPQDGAYTITIAWDCYDNEPSESFTFLSAEAYFDLNNDNIPDPGLDPILAVVYLDSAPSPDYPGSTRYALSVSCPSDNKDPRNGQFNVDILMGAYGVGGAPHIPTDNHPIPYQFAGVIIIESSLQMWNRAPITIRVGGRGVSVLISPSEYSASPGENIDFNVTVINTGNVTDNYDLTVSDNAVPSWNPSLWDYLLENIGAGENKTTTLTVKIPENALPGEEDEITVTATSTEDPMVSDSASCVTRVAIVMGVDVDILPENKSGAPEEMLTYEVTVTNMGAITDTYDLTVSDTAGWSPAIFPDSLTLGAGENGTATLAVTIPSDAAEGDSTRITVTATSRTDPTVSDSASCIAHSGFAAVEVSVTPEDQSGEADYNILEAFDLAYTVTVLNKGTITDTYTLTVSDNAGWSLLLSDNTLEVPVGKNKTTTLYVKIPLYGVPLSSSDITVTATSQTNNMVSDNANCVARVAIVDFEIELSPSYQRALLGEDLFYTLTVTNTGTGAIPKIHIWSVSDTENWIPEKVYQIAVPVGESKDAYLTVRVPDNATHCTRDNLIIKVETFSFHTGLWIIKKASAIAHAITLKHEVIILRPPPKLKKGMPGDDVSFPLVVRNLGLENDTYDLTVVDDALPSWNWRFDDNSLENVENGESRSTTLWVTIPDNAPPGMEDNLMVIATSRKDPTISASDNCIVLVEYFPRGVEVSISPGYQSGTVGTTLEYAVIIKNLGINDDNYTLENSDDKGWPLELENDVLEIPAGESRTTKLTVTIPENAAPSTRDTITITATSQENVEVSDSASCIVHVVVVPMHPSIVRGKGTAYSVNNRSPPPWKAYERGSLPPLMMAKRVGSGAAIAAGFAPACRDGHWNHPENPDNHLPELLDASFQWMVPGATTVLWYEGYGVYNNIGVCATLVEALGNLGYTISADTSPFTATMLGQYDILVIPQMQLPYPPSPSKPSGDPDLLPDADVQAIKNWVDGGGGLLIMEATDFFDSKYPEVHNKVLLALGFDYLFQDDSVYDDINNIAGATYRAIVDVDPTTEIGAAYQSLTGKTTVGMYGYCSLAQSGPGVSVKVVSDYQVDMPGTTLEYDVVVFNPYNPDAVDLTYEILVMENADWSPSVSPTSLSVPIGENRTATLTVTVPTGTPLGTEDEITVLVTASGYTGITDSFTCYAHAGKRIEPTDDAYVSDAENDKAYGADNPLALYTGRYGEFWQNTYLQFDLLTLPSDASITDARLFLFCYNVYGTQVPIAVTEVNDDAWDELTITWNNKPETGTILDQQLVHIGERDFPISYSWDVTSFVDQEFKGDKIVSLCLGGLEDQPISVNESFLSKDWPYEDRVHPFLRISYTTVVVERRVSVSISPMSKSGEPGDTLNYTVTVRNEGTLDDSYSLTVTDTAGWSSSISPSTLWLDAGTSCTATLTVAIPSGAAEGASTTITVTATSQENVEVSDSVSCVARVQEPLGMVSYWKFDEGSGPTAFDSVGGNHGTIYGATWTSGIVGGALSFDGDGDYVWVSDDPSLDISEKITIEAWVNITDRSDFRAVVVKQGNYHFRIHNGYLGFVFWTMSGWRGAEDDTTLLDTLTWYHIAVSFDTVNEVIKFYVNGNNVKTITNVGYMITNDNPFTIGRQTGALYTNYFNGIIDEVVIYNRALSEAEVLQRYLGIIGAAWDASITATFSGGSDDAIFGVRPDATPGFDSAYDIPEPPPPVAPSYVRTFFYYPGQTPDELHRSCLEPENLMEWPLKIEYVEGLEDITLTWNVEDVPVDYPIFLYRGENLVADMRAEDDYTFEASTGSYDFRIVVGRFVSFTLELDQGWNMISFPVLPENSSPDSIFDGYYVLYRWDAVNKRYMLHADSGSFVEPDPDVEVGVGYWAYVLEDENVTLLGVPVDQLTLNLRLGWNMIGPPYGGSSIADPADNPDNSIIPWAFTWNAGERSYSMTQQLEEGKGYWVYAMRDCELLLNVSNVYPPSPYYEVVASVDWVWDGDTIDVWIENIVVELDPEGEVYEGNSERVRFGGGIDAPEMGSGGGAEAKEFVENLLPTWATVYLDLDILARGGQTGRPYRGVYERLISVIYTKIDGQWVNVNAELLRWGLEKYPGHNWLRYTYIPSEFDPYEWLEENYPYVRG